MKTVVHPNTTEDAWAYPRPPALEPVTRSVRIVFAGKTIAMTTAALRVLETSHPPVYYLPPGSFFGCTLDRAAGAVTVCEWKGAATYWDIRAGASVARSAAWSYPTPTPAYAALRDHLAVYPGAMEQCFVGDELVTPQPGGFYGGWITSDIKGPFKGGPGTRGW